MKKKTERPSRASGSLTGSLFGDVAPVARSAPAIELPPQTAQTTPIAPGPMTATELPRELPRAKTLSSSAPNVEAPPAPTPPPTESVARPKLRLIVSPDEPEENVTLEPNGHGQFVLDFTRDKGTTRGGVVVTRGQLEKLLRIGPAALALGDAG